MDTRKLLRSFSYALQGFISATKQQNMRIHLISAVIVIIAGILTGLRLTEWLILIIIISLVIGTEMVNTAIEAVVDLASPEIQPLAKLAKDVAAGAVFVFAVASIIIGVLIFFPKWF